MGYHHEEAIQNPLRLFSGMNSAKSARAGILYRGLSNDV